MIEKEKALKSKAPDTYDEKFADQYQNLALKVAAELTRCTEKHKSDDSDVILKADIIVRTHFNERLLRAMACCNVATRETTKPNDYKKWVEKAKNIIFYLETTSYLDEYRKQSIDYKNIAKKITDLPIALKAKDSTVPSYGSVFSQPRKTSTFTINALRAQVEFGEETINALQKQHSSTDEKASVESLNGILKTIKKLVQQANQAEHKETDKTMLAESTLKELLERAEAIQTTATKFERKTLEP